MSRGYSFIASQDRLRSDNSRLALVQVRLIVLGSGIKVSSAGMRARG